MQGHVSNLLYDIIKELINNKNRNTRGFDLGNIPKDFLAIPWGITSIQIQLIFFPQCIALLV